VTIAWSRRAADELWSGVVTPLTFSLLAEQMALHMAQKRLRQAGLTEVSQQPVFKLIRGHVYVNASLIHDVMQEVPSVLLSDGVLALLPRELQEDLRHRRRSFLDPRTISTVVRLTWNERGWLPWSRADLFRTEAARVEAEFARFEVSPEASPAQIAAQLKVVRGRLGEFLDVVSWAMIYAYVFFHLAVHLAHEWLLDEEPLSLLMAGIPGIRTFEVHQALSAVAAEVRADPELARRVREETSAEVIAACGRGELGSVGSGILEICRQHGHRLVARDLAFPTWGEKPEVLVDMVRRLASTGPAKEPADPAQALAHARSKIAVGLGGAVRWQLFETGLGWCKEYYAVRENMRYHADYFLAAFRRLALAAATTLVKRGALVDVDDVFYLTGDELEAALAEQAAEPSYGALAADRRREYEGFREEAPPEVVWGDRDTALGATEPSSTGTRATPASPGVIEGAACVVRSVDDLDQVEPGNIIVATATDPTWTSYLSLAAGLVLEVGGLLSHGAIIAREMGIPAVVDLAGATREFRSGERLRVDGTVGSVERLVG